MRIRVRGLGVRVRGLGLMAFQSHFMGITLLMQEATGGRKVGTRYAVLSYACLRLDVKKGASNFRSHPTLDRSQVCSTALASPWDNLGIMRRLQVPHLKYSAYVYGTIFDNSHVFAILKRCGCQCLILRHQRTQQQFIA